MSQNLINVHNGRSIVKVDRNEIKDQLRKFVDENTKCKKFKYKNFDCVITYGMFGHFCGYVEKLPDEIAQKFTLEELSDYKNIQDLYVPHGGYTATNGFDCMHMLTGDLSVQIDEELEKFDNMFETKLFLIGQSSFKSEKFVELEIEHIVDSFIEISKSR